MDRATSTALERNGCKFWRAYRSTKTGRLLPDVAALGWHHGLTNFAAKCFTELGHIYKHTIGSKAVRRVGIGCRNQSLQLRTPSRTPVLGETEEQLLDRGESVE